MTASNTERPLAPISRRTLLRYSSLLAAAATLTGYPLYPLTAARAMASPPTSAAIRNIQVSHDSYAFHVEPFLAVNPRNPRNLLGIAQFFQNTTDPHQIGTFTSFDGGQSWQDHGLLTLPPGLNYADNMTVAFTQQGTGYVVAMSTLQTATTLSNVRGVYLWRTDDGGRTFRDPVTVAQGDFVDYPWIATEPGKRSTSNAIYVTWICPRARGLSFSRSRDGGLSFEASRVVLTPNGGMFQPALAAGPRGLLCAVYKTLALTTGAGTGHTGSDQGATPLPLLSQIEAIISTDGGNTFSTPIAFSQVPDQPMPSPQVLLTTGSVVAIDPFRSSIYIAYAAYRPGSTNTEILVHASHDRGQTWSDPVHVSGYPDTDLASYFQPQVSIDESGHIAVSAFVLNQGLVDVVLAISVNRGASFGTYRRLTNQSFNPAWGPASTKHGSWWIGDFQGLASSPGQFHAFWNDARTGMNHMDIFTATISAKGTDK